MSQSFFKVKKGISFPGNTANPSDVAAGDLHYRSDLNLLYFYNGTIWQQVTLGVGGSGGGIQKATYINGIVTTLPTGTAYTPDGIAVVNGDTVLFTNLGSGNNEIYAVTGVGTSLVWTVQLSFAGVALPTEGDLIYVKGGTSSADEIYYFDGTTWLAISEDHKILIAGENLASGDFVYVSVGNANGDTGNTLGNAYKYSPFNIYKCQIAGAVENAVTTGQSVLVQVGGVHTFGSVIAASTDYGASAYATSFNTISTSPTSIQRSNTTPTAHSWGLHESWIGQVLNSTQILINIQNVFVPSLTKTTLALSNVVANLDATLPNISSMSDGMYSTIEYSILHKNISTTDRIQTGRLVAWKGDGVNWDYSHSFNTLEDLGFRISVTAGGVIQYIAPTATINSITYIKLHSVNNRG